MSIGSFPTPKIVGESLIDYIRTIFIERNFSIWSISAIRITDLIDILIVAYLIYKIVGWIQETRAWSLFKGMVVILLAMGLSRGLQLHTVYWIISNTFNVGLIALIVLFQPELRKALEQIGKGQMTRIFSNGESTNKISNTTVTALVNAAKILAKARTGAIIVVEKDVALGDHERTGIPIDGAVTEQLLVNIFVDKTPLHDGAVIIRNNRIAAASCILPLTQEEIGRELGTRHRAAVGTSEVSDANVIVVSEETGYISVANSGKLYRDLTEEQLTEMLNSHNDSEKRKLVLWKGWHQDEEVH